MLHRVLHWLPTFRRNPLKIKALRFLETSRYTNTEIQGHISEDLNPLPSMPAVCVCVGGGASDMVI